MFEKLFKYRRVLACHRDGPFAEERAHYQCEIADENNSGRHWREDRSLMNFLRGL